MFCPSAFTVLAFIISCLFYLVDMNFILTSPNLCSSLNSKRMFSLSYNHTQIFISDKNDHISKQYKNHMNVIRHYSAVCMFGE